jgi:hypothetical protein
VSEKNKLLYFGQEAKGFSLFSKAKWKSTCGGKPGYPAEDTN